MGECAAQKVRTPTVIVKIGTRSRSKASLRCAAFSDPHLGRIVGQELNGDRRWRSLDDIMTPLAAVAKAAKARSKVGTQRLFLFARVRQEATGIPARDALAANRHLVLLKAVQKLARVSLFAAIVEPIATHFSLVDCLEGQTLCGLLRLRLSLEDALKFKRLGGTVHLLDI